MRKQLRNAQGMKVEKPVNFKKTLMVTGLLVLLFLAIHFLSPDTQESKRLQSSNGRWENPDLESVSISDQDISALADAMRAIYDQEDGVLYYNQVPFELTMLGPVAAEGWGTKLCLDGSCPSHKYRSVFALVAWQTERPSIGLTLPDRVWNDKNKTQLFTETSVYLNGYPYMVSVVGVPCPAEFVTGVYVLSRDPQMKVLGIVLEK